VLGQADALSADSPVTLYAVKQTGGKLQLAGTSFDSAPYGLAVAKNAGTLKDALQKAIQSMIDGGTYKEILTKWGVESGGIPTATINGAQS
jgi:polar amino acid transport system substrate-binding protein